MNLFFIIILAFGVSINLGFIIAIWHTYGWDDEVRELFILEIMLIILLFLATTSYLAPAKTYTITTANGTVYENVSSKKCTSSRWQGIWCQIDENTKVQPVIIVEK